MLGGYRAETNLFLGAIAIVISLKEVDGRNGGGVDKGKKPRCRRLICATLRLLTSHREVAESFAMGDIIVAAQIVILVYDAAVHITYICRNHSVPHLATDNRLDCVGKPSECRVSVADFKHRNTNWNSRTFGKRFDFEREITEFVESSNALLSIETSAKGVVHQVLVLRHNFFLRTREEVFVEILDEELLDEGLKTEHNEVIFTKLFQSTHTGSEVTYDLGHSLGILVPVNLFIEVALKERVNLIHQDSPPLFCI